MARLVGLVSRLMSQERAEPSRFSELGSLHERAAPSQARLGLFPALNLSTAELNLLS
jgi:hypothetical protein